MLARLVFPMEQLYIHFFSLPFFFAVLYFLGYLNVWSMDGQDYIGGNGQWNKRETENSPC